LFKLLGTPLEFLAVAKLSHTGSWFYIEEIILGKDTKLKVGKSLKASKLRECPKGKV
jgi:predicted nuclease of restriction endonuclease-like (RecB) superfamily